MSTKTALRFANPMNSFNVWKTSWICYRSKFSQIVPAMMILMILPLLLTSVLSWNESIKQVRNLYTLPPDTSFDDLIDWCFNLVGAWARVHFLIYAFLFLTLSFGYTFVCRIFLDYFLCERLETKILLKKTLPVFLKLILFSTILNALILIFSSPILPLFLACFILTCYLNIHAFYFSEQSFNPVKFFFANIFLKFINGTTNRKFDFFFMSFSTIATGLALFYGLESLLMVIKGLESKTNTLVNFSSYLSNGLSFYAIFIDGLEAIGLSLILSYLAVVTTTAFFQSQTVSASTSANSG